MAFVHPHSTPCTKSELDLFTVPATQVVLEKGSWIDFQPISNITPSAPIEFQVTGTENYLDLAKTMLFIKFKVTKADGSNLDNDEKVGPVNLPIQSLFKQVDVFLNGNLITQSTGTYSYKSMFETLLNYGPAVKQSALTGSLYYKDTAGSMDNPDPTATGANQGLQARYTYTQQSYTCDMWGPLHCDILFSERLLLNHVNVTIKLIPNPPAFTLMSGEAAPNYKINVVSAVLKVRSVKVSPSLQLLHLEELKKGTTAKYPIRRVDCKTYTIPRGNPSIHKGDLFNGLVPKRIVLGMVDSDAFNGSFTKNPYNFQLYNASTVKLSIDGEMLPFQTIHLKLATVRERNYMEAYQTLFSGTGRLFADSGIDISHSEYNRGFGLMVFDLTADLCSSSDHFNPKQKGNVTLEIVFTQGLPNAINLIVFAEFESIVEIDYGRHVTYDYSA